LSDLRNELLLRLGRVALAALLGSVLYLLLVGPLAEPPSVTLALLSFLVGASVLRILASSPL
jgi:hypothetical protein